MTGTMSANTTLDRLRRHRRKRRALVGVNGRDWKRSHEHYETFSEEECLSNDAKTLDDSDFCDECPIDGMPELPRPVTPTPLDVKSKQKKSLRFADDVGEPLTKVHYSQTMYTLGDLNWIRAIILLLNSKKRKFEFIHVSYHIEERTSISDILKQLPDMATDEDLKSQTYTGLCRVTEFGRELINTVSIQGYELYRDEILVAILNGVSGNSQLKTAQPLLDNKKILRAVKRAKAHGQAVKRFETTSSSTNNANDTSNTKDKKLIKKKKQISPLPREEPMDENSIPDMSMPQHFPEVQECARDSFLQEEGNKNKLMLTRVLNAGMMAVVAFTLNRAGSKRSNVRSTGSCIAIAS